MQTILYVDDEPINLRLFAINLRRNFVVLTANSAEEGIEMLKSHTEICAVVSDMRMPGMNGLEFIRAAQVNRPDIRYFILTGYDITSEISDALKDRVILEYFSKPFKPNEVIEVINKSLGSIQKL